MPGADWRNIPSITTSALSSENKTHYPFWGWESCQGRRFLAFISTLDSSPSPT